MSPAIQQRCITAVLLTDRSQTALLECARQLSGEEQRQVRDRLIPYRQQRLLDLWEEVCALADPSSART